jgi:hypothetical protein
MPRHYTIIQMGIFQCFPPASSFLRTSTAGSCLITLAQCLLRLYTVKQTLIRLYKQIHERI